MMSEAEFEMRVIHALDALEAGVATADILADCPPDDAAALADLLQVVRALEALAGAPHKAAARRSQQRFLAAAVQAKATGEAAARGFRRGLLAALLLLLPLVACLSLSGRGRALIGRDASDPAMAPDACGPTPAPSPADSGRATATTGATVEGEPGKERDGTADPEGLYPRPLLPLTTNRLTAGGEHRQGPRGGYPAQTPTSRAGLSATVAAWGTRQATGAGTPTARGPVGPREGPKGQATAGPKVTGTRRPQPRPTVGPAVTVFATPIGGATLPPATRTPRPGTPPATGTRVASATPRGALSPTPPDGRNATALPSATRRPALTATATVVSGGGAPPEDPSATPEGSETPELTDTPCPSGTPEPSR
ncbi:MAG TPA: hypothetical protein PLZ56_06735, partial [Anaerolineae bacterium]|nr:hypothetical protein [Anaerolineae bacterium]